MSVVLVKPNSKKKQYGRVVHLSAIEPPVWLALYANKFPGASVIDMEAEDLSADELPSRLAAAGAKKVVVFATGSHPSAHIQQTEAAEELKARIRGSHGLGGIPIEIHSHLPYDPNAMGAVNWDLLPVERYRAHNWHAWGRGDRSYGATFSSISFPFQCEFCCVRDFYHSDYAQRDPRLVVADIQALVARGVSNFKMMDELFALNNKVVNEVLALLAASGLGEKINIWAYARIDTVNAELLKKLKKAGVLWLAYGIESGDPEIRRGVDKGNFTNQKIADVIRMTKDAGISIVGNYMFGFWEDTRATMQETFDFARELNCEYSNFYCVTVYPGSALHDEMKARGVDLPRSGSEFAQMSPNFKPVPTRHLTGGQVLAFRDNAFEEYYAAPGYRAMMREKFGAEVVQEIADMLSVNLRDKV
jgi:hypothetical protein